MEKMNREWWTDTVLISGAGGLGTVVAFGVCSVWKPIEPWHYGLAFVSTSFCVMVGRTLRARSKNRRSQNS